MLYTDPVYGKINITDPVVLKIIKSQAMQRLKGVSHAGYRLPYKMRYYSRFEHCVGVYILLHKYQAPLPEQISGLIHDVSHSAFSHCIDNLVKTGKHQNHQDDIFDDFIKKTTIPKILKHYKIDLEYILDDKNFPLKETLLPELCADRIDYILRDGLARYIIDKKQVNYLLDNLIVKDNVWIFKNYTSAQKFAKLFLKLNNKYFSAFKHVAIYEMVADCFKYAIEMKYITMKDLYTTDAIVLDKIKKHLRQDKQLALLWRRMNNKVKVINSKTNGKFMMHKSRMVDPRFLDNGKINKISNTSAKWKKTIIEAMKPKQFRLVIKDV